MNLIQLTEELISSIIVDKDSLAIKQFPTEDERTVLLQVIVSENDMPRVIGKNGKVINAIRTLVQASSYIKENKIIKINIDSI